MKESEYSWTVKLDWLNILNLLQIDSIKQISEAKREKAIKKITKTFGKETLLELEPSELDNLVVDELKESMKKELAIYERRKKRMEQEIRNKVIPFKQGGIIKIDPRDLKDLNIDSDKPEDILKALYKKLTGESDKDDDKDDDKNNYYEDNTGYYI